MNREKAAVSPPNYQEGRNAGSLRGGWSVSAGGILGAGACRGGAGNWIIAMATPGMATGEAFQSHPTSRHTAVGFDGVEAILRAGGGVAAPGGGPAQPMKQGGDRHLIKPEQADKQWLHVQNQFGAHGRGGRLGPAWEGGAGMGRGDPEGSSPALPASRRHSVRRVLKSAPTEARRAMVTKAGRSGPCSRVARASRMISRRRRLSRFRTGALPNALGTMTPACSTSAPGRGNRPKARRRPPEEAPCRRTASNSRRRVMRTGRGRLIARRGGRAPTVAPPDTRTAG